ncbi:MAG: sensor signal transduction histidine kinase, partial [Candidatus Aminicenantes bacterium]|nr:sensor signal transduction histidine kinase [Candidatus Aminicenantes bacterium]
METPEKKGPRIIAAFVVLLVGLFFAIEYFIRTSQEFSPTSATNALLTMMQVIVLILFLVLFFILGRNLVKLYVERKRNIVGSHFKTKLVLFFIALSIIPAFLLFFFASDLISRNIELWFKTPFDKVIEDTKSVADGVYTNAEETAYHYAVVLSREIQARRLVQLENRLALRDFIRQKLSEYKLDEIGIYVDDEELFTYLNPALPLQDYKSVQPGLVEQARRGERFSSIEPMGAGEMIRRGAGFDFGGVGHILVTAGRFFPQSYTQRISTINAYVQRYRLLAPQKITVKTFYIFILMFITLLIIFAASW